MFEPKVQMMAGINRCDPIGVQRLDDQLRERPAGAAQRLIHRRREPA